MIEYSLTWIAQDCQQDVVKTQIFTLEFEQKSMAYEFHHRLTRCGNSSSDYTEYMIIYAAVQR